MKNNNIENKLKKIVHIIESKKNTYFFIGFMIGIIPFFILLYLLIVINGDFLNIPYLFKITFVILGILTSLLSSLYVGNKSYEVMQDLFKEKYNIDYNQIKKIIKY